MKILLTTLLLGLLLVFAAPHALSQEGMGAEDNAAAADDYRFVRMATTRGDIVLALDEERAPVTTKNFMQYVQDGFYDGTIFHRVMENFVIQGGGFDAQGNKKDVRDPIVNEWENGLRNSRGTISMARLGGRADSATSQFFINVADNGMLDVARDGAAYAVFGRVIEGMDVVDEIRAVATGQGTLDGGSRPAVPTEPIVIETAREVESSDLDDDAMATLTTYRQRVEQLEQAREASFEEIVSALDESDDELEGGLEYHDAVGGTGTSPTLRDGIAIVYTGWLTDGSKFDSSLDSPSGPIAQFPLGGLIEGWKKAMPEMQVGGIRYLRIPPDMAYGSSGRPGIPANSTLIFRIELVAVSPGR